MSQEITEILDRITAGQSGAIDDLIPKVYEQMRQIARSALSQEAHKCDPTELVHEAYLRLVGNEKLAWQSRSHFFAACATVIRRLLVDQARARKASKRGGGEQPVVLDERAVLNEATVDLVELDQALEELENLSSRQVRLIELRYFGGLSESEAAEVLGVSRRTASGDWAMARAWLRSRLTEPA